MVASSFWTIAVLYLSFLSISPSYASTDTVSCVLFKDYLSPAHSYSIFFTDDTDTCWKACKQDPKCLVWTRDAANGKCALKSDCDILVSVAGAESGVKYISEGEPVLKYNGVGASLILAEEKPKPRAPTPTVVTASASAVSTGGSSVAIVSADESGISSKTAVTGDGSASTSASTSTLSLATTTVAKDGETSKLAVSYFKNVSYVGAVPIFGGKKVQIITSAVAEPPSLTSHKYTCISVAGAVYKGKKSCHGRCLSDWV